MEKKRGKSAERRALAWYSMYWLLALFLGMLSWALFYAFYLHPSEELVLTKAFFLIGLVDGVCAITCVSLLVGAVTPIVRWAWGKVRCQPRAFLELLN